jgi:hypothetical protein
MNPKYEKLTLDAFLERMESGKYQSEVSAGRAVSKAKDFSDAEKAKARQAVAKHFATPTNPTPKVVAPVPKPVGRPKKASPAPAALKEAPREEGHEKEGQELDEPEEPKKVFQEEPRVFFDKMDPRTFSFSPLGLGGMDRHKMDLAVRAMQAVSTGLAQMSAIAREYPLVGPTFETYLGNSLRTMDKATKACGQILDSFADDEPIADVVGPEEAGTDLVKEAAPSSRRWSPSIPKSERDYPASEVDAGQSLFRNSLPANRGA